MADESEIPPGLKLLLQNLSSLVQVQLNNNNYIVWKAQFQASLRANGLLDHVTGAKPCPATHVKDADGSTTPNPAFEHWLMVDEHLKSCFYASMSSEVLPQVLDLPSSTAIWHALEHRFSSLSRTHVHQLKLKLYTLSKGSQSMQAYLDQVKAITDSLRATGYAIDEDDLILYILKGLPSEYESVKTTLRLRPVPITVAELTSQLLSEE